MTTATTTTTDLDHLREVAAEGQRAAETLAAAEHERQAQRTATLAAEQGEYDRDLCRRGPEVDGHLDATRDEALAGLQAAVDDGDIGAALLAWRREAAARYGQRTWRQEWRTAHARTGEGPTPPAPSERDAERDEQAGFLVVLAQAAESGARLDADGLAMDLVRQRPTAVAGELVPGPEAALTHAEGCADPSRTETTHPPVGRHSQGTVVRCTSCQASRLVYAPPPEPEDVEAAAPGPDLLRRPEPNSPLGWS